MTNYSPYKIESYVVFLTPTPDKGRFIFVCNTLSQAIEKANKWMRESVPTPLYVWHKIVTPTKITLEFKVQIDPT